MVLNVRSRLQTLAQAGINYSHRTVAYNLRKHYLRGLIIGVAASTYLDPTATQALAAMIVLWVLYILDPAGDSNES